MMDQSTDKARSESAELSAETLPTYTIDRRQEIKDAPAIADVAPQAGPVLQIKTVELAAIEAPAVSPVSAEKEKELVRTSVKNSLFVKPLSEKEIVSSHVQDLADDLVRICQGAPNVIKKILARQTLAVDLNRLLQESGYSVNDCLGMVSIRDHSMKTVVVLTLPAGKMANRIQLKMAHLGFTAKKSDLNVVIKSPNAEF